MRAARFDPIDAARKFSTTTSALLASRRNTSRPLGSFKLSVIAGLLRCRFWESGPWRGPTGFQEPRIDQAVGISLRARHPRKFGSCRLIGRTIWGRPTSGPENISHCANARNLGSFCKKKPHTTLTCILTPQPQKFFTLLIALHLKYDI